MISDSEKKPTTLTVSVPTLTRLWGDDRSVVGACPLVDRGFHPDARVLRSRAGLRPPTSSWAVESGKRPVAPAGAIEGSLYRGVVPVNPSFAVALSPTTDGQDDDTHERWVQIGQRRSVPVPVRRAGRRDRALARSRRGRLAISTSRRRGRAAANGRRPGRGVTALALGRVGGRVGLGRQLLAGVGPARARLGRERRRAEHRPARRGAGAGRRRNRDPDDGGHARRRRVGARPSGGRACSPGRSSASRRRGSSACR